VLNSLQFTDTLNYGSIYNNGTVYIYMGKDQPIDSADYYIRGINVFSYYGYSFQVGNINGDDYDDLLISSEIDGIWGKDSLAVLHVYYGKPDFTFYPDKESIKYLSRYHGYMNKGSRWSDWFRPNFSVDDINGDKIDDIVVGGMGYDSNKDTTRVYFSNNNGIDTTLSFIFTNPDTVNDDDYLAGGLTHNIGDFNGDGYDDFVLPHGIVFILQLGGPYASNKNRYGERGLLDSDGNFPKKALDVGDQNGDGENDFACIARTYTGGAVLVFLGNHLIKTDVKNIDENVIENFSLYQNYPNPFNPETVISYQLSVNSKVNLKVYDNLGKELAILVNQEQEKGFYKITFNATKYNLSSGVYYYELNINHHQSIKKMMLIK